MSSFGYICTPRSSCLNPGLFWVGSIKQPLRRVKRKTESPRYDCSDCSVLGFLLGQTVPLFEKELVHPFCLREIIGDILL